MLHQLPYRDDAFLTIQAALARWRATAGPCGYCHPGELFHRIYGEPRRLPPSETVLCWEGHAGVAALAIVGRFGTAFDLFCAPELRGSPEELRLLAVAAHTTEHMLAAGGTNEPVTSDVQGCDTVRQAQLSRLGFERYRVWDWITARGLAEPFPAAGAPAGFVVRHAAPADAAELAAARVECFGGDWTAASYREGVMMRPGYRLEQELIAVAPDGHVAAFLVLWPDQASGEGQIEPVGTRPAFRRLGLARALLLHALSELRRLGMHTALISHDAANGPGRELYRGLGFVRRDETLGYQLAVRS